MKINQDSLKKNLKDACIFHHQLPTSKDINSMTLLSTYQ